MTCHGCGGSRAATLLGITLCVVCAGLVPEPRKHRVTVEAQTWRNVPPFPETSMYRAKCTCGWVGQWFHYEENVAKTCGAEEVTA